MSFFRSLWASKPQRSSCLHLPSVGFQVHTTRMALGTQLRLSCFCDKHFTDPASPQPHGKGLLPIFIDKETKDRGLEHLSPTSPVRKCLSQKGKFVQGHLCLSCSAALYFQGVPLLSQLLSVPLSERPERAVMVMSPSGAHDQRLVLPFWCFQWTWSLSSSLCPLQIRKGPSRLRGKRLWLGLDQLPCFPCPDPKIVTCTARCHPVSGTLNLSQLHSCVAEALLGSF